MELYDRFESIESREYNMIKVRTMKRFIMHNANQINEIRITNNLNPFQFYFAAFYDKSNIKQLTVETHVPSSTIKVSALIGAVETKPIILDGPMFHGVPSVRFQYNSYTYRKPVKFIKTNNDISGFSAVIPFRLKKMKIKLGSIRMDNNRCYSKIRK